MSTRSDIIAHMSDGSWCRIFCRYDGYLGHNGKVLFENYTDQAKVEALIKLGDLKTLNPEIGVKHPLDPQAEYGSVLYLQHKKLYGRMCDAYGRDGDSSTGCVPPGNEAMRAESLAGVWPGKDSWTELTYVWKDGKWWVAQPHNFPEQLVDLGEALSLLPDAETEDELFPY